MPSHTERSEVDLPTLQAACRRSLRSRIPPEQFNGWFQEVELVAADGDEFVFLTPSVFVRDRIQRHLLRPLEASLREVTGRASSRAVLRIQPAPRAADVDLTTRQHPESPSRPSTAPETAMPAGFPTDDPHSFADDPGAGAGPSQPGPSGFGGQPFAAGSAPQAGQPFAASGPYGAGPAPQPEQPFGTPATPRPSGYAATSSGSPGSSGFDISSALNRNYTFDTFVVGPCNRLSHAAALAVGDNPGRAYNPLFIHGNVGLGKTHLLQSICQVVSRRRDVQRVLYMSCEDFTNRFIHCIQRGALDAFREFHRSVDVLVIDDVQFLANKDKTQEEFFHTFNALYNTNRQIIISSDRSPTEIPTIEERLVSRFKWGLVAEMEVPCFETRCAIVKRKARLRQVDMPDDVAWFIAERIDTNIRELEGAVIKVLGVASITQREVTVDLAEEALKGVVVSRSRKLTLADIMGVVTAHFSVSARELTGKGRTQAISLPRQIAMYLCRHHTEQSLEEIGRFFGNRDHTTVIYAVQRIKKRLKEDRVFHELVSTLSSRLHG